MALQIGFLTEWQLYAQKMEGDNWAGEKLDKSKLDKMSGMIILKWVPGVRLLVLGSQLLTCIATDQQIGQLFELFQAIRNEGEGGEGEGEGQK